jgi:hypothetical protein
MPLTHHQKIKSKLWQDFTKVFDSRKLVDCANQLNKLVNRKPIGINARHDGFNYPLLGKSVIYAFVLTFYPDYLRETLAGRFLVRSNQLGKVMVAYSYDLCRFAIVLALVEDLARKGMDKGQVKLTGIKALNAGLATPVNLDLYNDLTLIAQSFDAIHKPSKVEPAFNVTFNRSALFGGADCQMVLGGQLWSTISTLKRVPLTADKLEQQLAYYLLDWSFTDRKHYSGLSQLAFHFSRQQSILEVNPWDLLLPLSDPAWLAWSSQFDAEEGEEVDDSDYESEFFFFNTPEANSVKAFGLN